MQASIDGSEEVWSAILASILTHIAVFVPCCSSKVCRASCSAAVGRGGLLAADVALRGRDAGAGPLLTLYSCCHRPSRSGARSARRCTASASDSSTAWTRVYQTAPPRARPSSDRRQPGCRVGGRCRGRRPHAATEPPPRPTRVRCRSAWNSRRARASKSPTPCCSASRLASPSSCLKPPTSSHQPVRPAADLAAPAAARQSRSAADSAQAQDERQRSSDQIAQDLRRQLSGYSRRHRPRTGVGRQQPVEPLPLRGGNNGGGRLSLEIRGDRSRRCAQGCARREGTCSTRCPASRTRASVATMDVRNWRSKWTVRRRRCSA